ncbi:hypothetical protein [Nonomuraea sp. NPDC049725]|uniref:coiled-coil domain-containing protein n=1 Tax=Nonomuraea sp. NPDC049725 TaxID=3154508 RepID=UPI0034468E1F
MAVASPAGRRRGSLGSRTAVLAVVAALLIVPGTAGADPKPTVKGLEKELAALRKDSDRMIEDYYHGRRELQRVEKAEKAAREKLEAAQEILDRESTYLRTMAVAEFMSGRRNELTMVAEEEDPADLLNRLALRDHLIAQQQARLSGYTQVRDRHLNAQKEAEARAEELSATVGDLAGKQEKAEKQIERIRDKIDQLHKAPGRRGDGTWLPQLPGGPDNITPRMRLVKTLIAKRFVVPFGIGCYRAIQDGGEHPLGRACDFMLSRGGAMPSAAEIQRGHDISAWAIKNAKRLGIMYIIYRQRIWHVRTGAWRYMSDRGGATANHYDHPHISVY